MKKQFSTLFSSIGIRNSLKLEQNLYIFMKDLSQKFNPMNEMITPKRNCH